eukprot:6747452-Pyramimonas_sp.AAC.1
MARLPCLVIPAPLFAPVRSRCNEIVWCMRMIQILLQRALCSARGNWNCTQPAMCRPPGEPPAAPIKNQREVIAGRPRSG